MPELRLLALLSPLFRSAPVPGPDSARGTFRARRAARYFVFVGEDGSALGGMQDYYGAYDTPEAARAAVPSGVHWAEIATVRDDCLQLVLTGTRTRRDGGWRWQDLDAGEAGDLPPLSPAPGGETAA